MRSHRRFLQDGLRAGAAAALAPFAASVPQAVAKAASQQAPSSNPQPNRPNILLLYPDQWRFDWMSENPLLPIRTPNLDRLAKNGTRFTQVVVATPLCAPSRACLASGMEYGKTGVASNGYDFPIGRRETFYSMLRDAGYHVLGCGKMDLAKASDWWGIDGKWRLTPLGFSDGINNAGKIDQIVGYQLNNNRPADPYLTFLDARGLIQEHLQDLRGRLQGGYAAVSPTPLPDNAYCDNWLGQNGLDLLDAAPQGKPWFVQVNWTGPHNPEDITKSMESQVRGRKMPDVNGQDKYDNATNQAIRQNYTAMCENIDRNIGLYLEKLESRGELDNTIVIFSSDHGEMLGDHGRWGKIVPYHPSASVPLIVSGPSIGRGQTSAALISHIDITATCLDYAGIAVPKKMDGKSMRATLEGRSATHRETLFSGLGAWRMAYDGQYKAITGFNPQLSRNSPDWTTYSPQAQNFAPLVFDLEQDPGENRDLSSSMPEKGKRLLAMLADRASEHSSQVKG